MSPGRRRQVPAVEIESDLDLVRIFARKMLRRCKRHGVEYDDLYQWGVLGLLDAARRFDRSKGASFRTFAGPRVTGAMLDGLRGSANGWSRSLRAARRAGGFRVDVAETLAVRPLEAVEMVPALAAFFPSTPESPGDALARRERAAAVQSAIAELPARERFVVLGRMREETNAALGRRLGVNESRASQLYGSALKRLRRRLARVY